MYYFIARPEKKKNKYISNQKVTKMEVHASGLGDAYLLTYLKNYVVSLRLYARNAIRSNDYFSSLTLIHCFDSCVLDSDKLCKCSRRRHKPHPRKVTMSFRHFIQQRGGICFLTPRYLVPVHRLVYFSI